MIYTNYLDDYEKLVAEIEDDIFDNLLEKCPELTNIVEEYFDSDNDINKDELLKIVKDKLSDDIKYGQLDTSENDEYEQTHINAVTPKEEVTDPYNIMLLYINGDKNAINKLYTTKIFEIPSKKENTIIKHQYADNNLNVMLRNAISDYSIGYKKEEGWIKWFVTPADSQEIESIFNEVLFQLISGKYFTVDKVGNISYDIFDDDEKFPFEYILNSEIFYKQLKYIVVEIVNKRYTKRDGKLKLSTYDSKGKRESIPFAYEIHDTVTEYNAGGEDEYVLSLSDKQIYSDYLKNQCDSLEEQDERDIYEKLFFKPEPNCGYQYPYNSRLKNIDNMNIDDTPYFTNEQKKYIKFFLYKYKVGDNFISDKDFVKKYFKKSSGIYIINYQNIGEYFGVSDKSIIKVIGRIRNGFMKYFDEFGIDDIKNNLPFTFEMQYLMWLHNHLSGEGQSDFYSAEDIDTGKIDLSRLQLFTKHMNEYEGLLINIFDEYYYKFESGADFKGNTIDKKLIKTIVYDSIEGKKVLLKRSEVVILFFELSRCIVCYLDEMSNYINPENMYWDDDDIYKGYSHYDSGETRDYLNNTSEKTKLGIGYDYIKKCQFKPFINLWEIKYSKNHNSNMLCFYKVKYHLFRECMLPQRSKETLSFQIGRDYEIKYNLINSDKSFYLIDNTNKSIFHLFNEDRAEMNGNNRKIAICNKFI